MGTDTTQQYFLEMLRNNNGILHKVCRMYCYSVEDREDLYQEMIMQVWKAFPKFRQESKISTWIYRIALNTAISGYRKEQRSINTVLFEQDAIHAIYEEQDAEKNEKIKMMNEAIQHLTDVEKALIMLYLDDKSYEEMEEILGMSQGNLRVKMNRIKEKLRKIMIKP
ncbi:MAG: sigma-70 family RNA polymerase sigma factor [Agriterribacter sp.]